MKVFLFLRIVPHYYLRVYELLNMALKNGLVVSYGQQLKNGFFSTPDDCFSFKTVRVKNFWLRGETAVWQHFWKPFHKYGRPDVVIMEHSPRILSLFPLYFYCKLNRIPFILWGHGGSRKRSVSESRSIRDVVHRSIIRASNAYICYTDGIKNELSKITNSQKLFVARNTLDTKALFAIRKEYEKEGKASVKKRLGLNKQRYICFIGRLLAEKRTDYLMDVYELVKQKFPETGLLIIGDGPMKASLVDSAYGKGLEDVHILGSIPDLKQSGAYMFISDAMVMPGGVGLSVNHAFCFGLPVITQETGNDGPFHGPEVEYIGDGTTGFICKNGNKNEMAKSIFNVFENSNYFKKKTLNFCETNLSIETMIAGIKESIDFALKK